jgi:DNA-binding MarR family transcriptional regulator
MVDMSKQMRDEALAGLFRSLVAFDRATRALAHTWSTSQPDLSRRDVVALGVIAECGRCRPSALADHVGVGPSVVSRQLASLQQLGLVEREIDPEDGRAGLVSLTEAGHQRLASGRAAYLRRLAGSVDGWDDAKLHRAAELIDELTASLTTNSRTTSAPQKEPA